MLQISVVLPTFNEKDNIITLMERIHAVLPQADLWVMDDDSPDGTWAVAEQAALKNPRIHVVRRLTDRGLTRSIQAGIDAAKDADVVVWMDCDLSMPPETIPLLLQQIEGGADVAIGSRYRWGGADVRREYLAVAMSAVINTTAKVALGGHVRDFTTGFVAARRHVLDALRLNGDYGEYCIAFLARAERSGFRVKEVPYRLTSRIHGESKTAPDPWGFVRRGPKYLKTIVDIALTSRRP